MSGDKFKVTRRQALSLLGAGAATLAMPSLSAAQSGDKVTLLHGAGAPLLGWAPSFIAEALGYYKEEGLTVERIINGSGPAGLTALVSGAGQGLITGPGELLIAAARGQKLKVLFAESNYQAAHLVISKAFAAQHGITSEMSYDQKLAAAKSFKNFRCGISTPGSLTDLTARTVFKNVGLVPGSDVQIVPLGSVPNAMAALSSGNVDGFAGASPAPEQAEEQLGGVVLFSVGKDEIPGLRPMAGPVLEARASDVEENPDLYAALVRADTRALRTIIEDPKQAGDTFHKHSFTKLEKSFWDVVWQRNSSLFTSPYVTKESLEAWVTMGMVPGVTDPKSIDIDAVVEMKFVDQALQKLGWKVPA
ncbi:hypothetical protein GHK78_10300 [Sinorhizobium meliloti]|nr:hypothetical protein [Sinorhizobium meliloti]MDW9835943.1 hypothetical protein [Sinorhizobium meliloti]MDX0040368.1 hypothetical protein [Sinorhizobium meliloti]MDX0088890.1 hypothetical protein [Sinorhizobium meliloti]MQX63430.1 hypothetical protein [Sinorhizobium meliloti]